MRAALKGHNLKLRSLPPRLRCRAHTGRIAADATAFPYRRATHNMFSAVSWPLTGDPTGHVAYLKRYWATLEPSTDGYYTNEVGDEAQRYVDENYQGNLARLRAVKRKYDPANLFRLNANVKPA